jgi:hypothetical protein
MMEQLELSKKTITAFYDLILINLSLLKRSRNVPAMFTFNITCWWLTVRNASSNTLNECRANTRKNAFTLSACLL